MPSHTKSERAKKSKFRVKRKVSLLKVSAIVKSTKGKSKK